MRKTCRRRGALIIELLVALIIGTIAAMMVISAIQMTFKSRDDILDQNTLYSMARTALDIPAERMRNAQANPGDFFSVFPTDNGTTVGASDLTIYTNSAGDTMRYWLDTNANPNALKQTATVGGTATTTTILSGVTALTFTYYVPGAGFYTPSVGNWATTADPNVATSGAGGERRTVGAVGISCAVSFDGYTRPMSTFIRLRNSPRKTEL
jgi:type II secretory pathway pseudopilin PulG